MLKWITGLVAGLLLANSSAAMDTAGDWHGELNIQPGVSLPLVLHIGGSEPDWQVSLDSPNQGAFGIPGRAELNAWGRAGPRPMVRQPGRSRRACRAPRGG